MLRTDVFGRSLWDDTERSKRLRADACFDDGASVSVRGAAMLEPGAPAIQIAATRSPIPPRAGHHFVIEALVAAAGAQT